jgi:hypothetical protein
LTSLRINSKHIEELPVLPPNLQQLHVIGCSNLKLLPELPPTLQALSCQGCTALAELPSSLSSTAVSKLNCSDCSELKNVPQLPITLVELELYNCKTLMELPTLPQGLKSLIVTEAGALSEVSNTVLVFVSQFSELRMKLFYQSCVSTLETVLQVNAWFNA